MPVPTIRPPYPTKRPTYDMPLPFNPNMILQAAEAAGFSHNEATSFVQLALQQACTLQGHRTGGQITALQVAEAIKRYATAQIEREKVTEEELALYGVMIEDDMESKLMECENGMADKFEDGMTSIEENEVDGKRRKRFKFSQDGLDEYFGGKDPYNLENQMAVLSLKHTSHDIITALCQNVELAAEVGKHLPPQDILNLYIANTAFRDAVDGHLLSSIRMWIAYRGREASQIFSFKLYRRHLVPDPAGRIWGELYGCPQGDLPVNKCSKPRSVPGLKYLQLALGRDRYCREIIAIMARNGHRMPPTMHSTLLRLWLLNDVATTSQRQCLLRNEMMWTEEHLYNAQFFFVKLGMHFNDPMYGPTSYELVHLMLGQKGLYPLWQLLMRKNFTRLEQIIELKVRYNVQISPDHWDLDCFDEKLYNVPLEEIGITHLEGWGQGTQHLGRPDELIPLEAATRGLELDKHLIHMATWGYMDPRTGENLVPTEEEMYISDEDKALEHVDTRYHWRRRHCLKKRFNELTPEQQKDIVDDDEDERLRVMAWCGDEDEHDSSDEDYCDPPAYTLDGEIKRGHILQPRPKDQPPAAPATDDKQA